MKRILPALIFAFFASSFQSKQVMDNSNRSASSLTVKKPSVFLFDVNEILLDMSPLKKKVNEVLGNKEGFRIRFGMLLQYAAVDNSTGSYHEFSVIADANLDMAAKTKALGINNGDMLMVAAHGWDIAGALAAGMQAGFIERKGQSLYPLAPPPQYTGDDLV